jgi:hypothetical protein
MTNEFSKDWHTIRRELKHGGGSLHTDGAKFWLVMPIDAVFARQIISHPAIVPAGEYQIDGVEYEIFRWRPPSESPARKVFEAMKTTKTGSVQ